MSKVLSLIGFSKSGKDYIFENGDMSDYVRVAWGDALKQKTVDCFPWIINTPEVTHYLSMNKDVPLTHLRNVNNFTYRQLMNRTSDFFRGVNNEYFMDMTLEYIKQLQKSRLNICITDTRFPHEFHWVERQKGFNIAIHRDGAEANGRGDRSVVELQQQCTYSYNNEGSVDKFWKKYKDIV